MWCVDKIKRGDIVGLQGPPRLARRSVAPAEDCSLWRRLPRTLEEGGAQRVPDQHAGAQRLAVAVAARRGPNKRCVRPRCWRRACTCCPRPPLAGSRTRRHGTASAVSTTTHSRSLPALASTRCLAHRRSGPYLQRQAAQDLPDTREDRQLRAAVRTARVAVLPQRLRCTLVAAGSWTCATSSRWRRR